MRFRLVVHFRFGTYAYLTLYRCERGGEGVGCGGSRGSGIVSGGIDLSPSCDTSLVIVIVSDSNINRGT